MKVLYYLTVKIYVSRRLKTGRRIEKPESIQEDSKEKKSRYSIVNFLMDIRKSGHDTSIFPFFFMCFHNVLTLHGVFILNNDEWTPLSERRHETS